MGMVMVVSYSIYYLNMRDALRPENEWIHCMDTRISTLVLITISVTKCVTLEGLTIDVSYTGLFNGRIWDSCICKSLFT